MKQKTYSRIKGEYTPFAGLKKCENSVKKNYFGEAVKFQRKLRDEFDKRS